MHSTALVLGDIAAGAQVEAGATVSFRASLGPGATLSAGAFLAPRANVGEDAIIGVNTVIGRATTIGARTEIGDNSAIRRDATVGVDVDASVGDLTMGYASFLGDRSVVLGTNVVLGNLVTIGADSELGANVVVARAATFGDVTSLGQGTVIGPEVSALAGLTTGANTRIRKGTIFGADVTLGTGVRIGRDSELRQGAQVGDNTTLRSEVTVGTFYEVESDAYIQRSTVFEDQSGAFVPDQAPNVVITSPTDGASGDSGSLTLTGTVTDDFGVASVTVRIDDGTPVSIPFNNGQFTYTVTGIPDLSQTIRVTAFDANGNQGSDLLFVSDCNPNVSISHTWTGSISSDWNTAGNWSTGSVPITTSNVFVCGDSTTQPQLAANTTLARLYMDWDANLASDGRSLFINNTYSGGVTSGTGTVQANSGARVKGTVPNFVVNGDVFLTGVTFTTGNTSISSGVRRLRIGAYALEIQGDFSQYISGTDGGLYLRNSAGSVTITGNATFSGVNNMNTSSASSPMYAGTVRIGGNLSLPCSTSYDCLDPIGTHFILNGSGPQTLSISGGGTSGSQFHSLEIQNAEGVIASGTLYAANSFSVTNGGQFTAPNVTTGSVSGLNEFSGGAVVNISGAADLAGPIDVQDAASLTIATLQARSFFNMSPTSFYSGTTVNLYSQLVIPSDNYTAGNTVVRGDLTVPGPWDHTMPLLTTHATGRLRINAHEVILDGNFSQYITGTDSGLYLRDSAGSVTITGDAAFGGINNMNTTTASSPMYAGTIRIAGDLSLPCSTSYDCLDPIGTHFVLNGTSPQDLNINAGGTSGSQFHSLEIQNSQGVTATGTLYAARSLSVTNGGHLTAPNAATGSASGTNEFSGGAVVNISGAADFAGPIDVQDTSSLTIGTLQARSFFTMSPASSYSGATVNLYSQLVIPSDDYTASNTVVRGDLTVPGPWNHTMPLLTTNATGRLRINAHEVILNGNFSQYITGTDSGLYLRDSAGSVTITGNATFSGVNNMNTSSRSSPMYAGTIRIGGTLSLPCSTSYDCLDPIGTHFILNGSGPQTLSISGGGTSGSQFHSLEIQNQQGVTATGTLYAANSFSVTNGAQFTAPNVTTGSVSGLNEFSGGAVVSIAGIADFAGPIDVQDTSSLTIATLQARSFFTMSPASSYSGATVNLYSQLVIPSDDYTASNTVVRGDLTVPGPWNHTMPLLTTNATGRLRINAHEVILDGNFSQYITGTDSGLYLRDSAGSVTITGDAAFSGVNNMNTSTASSPMYAGTIRIAGNLSLPCSTSYDCLDPIGTHFILDGDSPQSLSISGGGTSGSQFHSLEIQNSQGVTATGTLYAARSLSVTNGGHLTAPNAATGSASGTNELSGGAVVNISGTADFAGPIDVQDTSSLTIGTLQARSFFTMSPASSYSGTTVNLYSQLVIPSDDYTASNTVVRGDLTVPGPWDHTMPLLTTHATGRLRINAHEVILDGNFSQYITGTDSGLYLRNSAGSVTITGDATFSGVNNMNTSSTSSPMYAGTIRIGGNLSLPCSTSYDCLDPIGTRFVLNGSSPQTLSISGGGTSGSQFHALEFANANGTTIQGTLYAASDIDITGTVTNNGSATTNTNLTIDGGVLNNNSSFRYNNTFTTPNGGIVNGNTPVNF
ncbi:MAG: UDP-3-O-[3-hydroxymyristoyl] glucosamine N-acyltransferase [bacterium]